MQVRITYSNSTNNYINFQPIPGDLFSVSNYLYTAQNITNNIYDQLVEVQYRADIIRYKHAADGGAAVNLNTLYTIYTSVYASQKVYFNLCKIRSITVPEMPNKTYSLSGLPELFTTDTAYSTYQDCPYEKFYQSYIVEMDGENEVLVALPTYITFNPGNRLSWTVQENDTALNNTEVQIRTLLTMNDSIWKLEGGNSTDLTFTWFLKLFTFKILPQN